MADLFKEIIPSLLQKNVKVPTDDYAPYITNRALSFHYDCILHANEMNKNPALDKSMQYDYLFHSLRKYKRPFQKWMKLEKNTDLELVKSYYEFSSEKAREALSLLSEEQLDVLRSRTYTGGKA